MTATVPCTESRGEVCCKPASESKNVSRPVVVVDGKPWPYTLQCAGHGYQKPGEGLMVLRERDGTEYILKPYQDQKVDRPGQKRGEVEAGFLELAWSWPSSHLLYGLQEFVPKFYGRVTL